MKLRQIRGFIFSWRDVQMAVSFECDSVIRGYHIYKEIWEASQGETFHCMRETGNTFDPFAVAVVRDGEIISHMRAKVNFSCCFSVFTTLWIN